MIDDGFSLRRLKPLFDGGDEVLVFGFSPTAESGEDAAVPADEKLVEVPGDVAAEFRVGRLIGQVFVQGMALATLHRDFFEHGKGYMVFQ